MLRPVLLLPMLSGLAFVAACGRSEAPAGAASDSPDVSATEAVPAPPPSSSPPPATAASAAGADAVPTAPASQPGGAAIPAALQGRWGLVPGDCTSTRGDAKGLLVIGPDTLRFYESTARAGTVSEQTSSRIRATFAFAGEGSVWTREMLLESSIDGRTLTRRDFGGESGRDPLTYTRC